MVGEANAKRAVIYARISRDQKGEGLGVERQEQLCRQLADALAVDVAQVYTDNDISAYSGRQRPAYERMLSDIQAGRVEVVLCYHSDRLMRRTKELERYIDICKPRNVVTHQVTAGVLDLSSATGLAVAKTIAAWSQHESDHKGERIQAQKAQAAKAGKFLGGPVPWGWMKDGDAIAVDPAAAGLIRSGTASVIGGHSLISVTRAWADAGATNGGGKRRNTTEVRRVLLRPRNAGLLTFHGEVVSDAWPAIVPLEDFRACEARLTDQSRPRQSESKFRYLLSGILLCHCGRYMTGFGVDAKRSYRCKIHQEGGKYVRGHASRAMEPLDGYVRQLAAAYFRRDDIQRALLAAAQDHADTAGPQPDSAIGDLLNRKNALARVFAQGGISESQLIEGTREVESKLAALEAAAISGRSSSVTTGLLLHRDPGAAFLESPVDVQREILRNHFTIEARPTGAYRGEFDPSSVHIEPKES